MHSPRRIGLSGGIGTGKSTVAAMLKEHGAIILDADETVHELYATSKTLVTSIENIVGTHIRLANGDVDRALLGTILFSNNELRSAVEDLVHPMVQARMTEREQAAFNQRTTTFFWDIPLLFERDRQAQLDGVIVVYAPDPIACARLEKRNGFTTQEALLRMQTQLSIEAKKRLATWIIDNSGDIVSTKKQVDTLWPLLMQSPSSS